MLLLLLLLEEHLLLFRIKHAVLMPIVSHLAIETLVATTPIHLVAKAFVSISEGAATIHTH